MQFDLSPSEVDLLVGLLDNQVGRKLVEIRRTDNRDFKHDLEREEQALEGLLGKLKKLQAEGWKAAGFR
jgi:hypothetical protein